MMCWRVILAFSNFFRVVEFFWKLDSPKLSGKLLGKFLKSLKLSNDFDCKRQLRAGKVQHWKIEKQLSTVWSFTIVESMFESEISSSFNSLHLSLDCGLMMDQ